MLSAGQKEYLSKLDAKRAKSPVQIKPYDQSTKKISELIIKIIKENILDADVRFMGASALCIAGQNDIDLYIVCSASENESYTTILSKIFGEKIKNKWHWLENGCEVSVYVKDPQDKKFKEQLDIFDEFKNSPVILKEYEDLKISMNGKSYYDYQVAKYEFYNRVLGIK